MPVRDPSGMDGVARQPKARALIVARMPWRLAAQAARSPAPGVSPTLREALCRRAPPGPLPRQAEAHRRYTAQDDEPPQLVDFIA